MGEKFGVLDTCWEWLHFGIDPSYFYRTDPKLINSKPGVETARLLWLSRTAVTEKAESDNGRGGGGGTPPGV